MGHTCGRPQTNLDDIRDEYGDITLAYLQLIKETEMRVVFYFEQALDKGEDRG